MDDKVAVSGHIVVLVVLVVMWKMGRWPWVPSCIMVDAVERLKRAERVKWNSRCSFIVGMVPGVPILCGFGTFERTLEGKVRPGYSLRGKYIGLIAIKPLS